MRIVIKLPGDWRAGEKREDLEGVDVIILEFKSSFFKEVVISFPSSITSPSLVLPRSTFHTRTHKTRVEREEGEK